MARIHILTFGGGSQRYREASQRLLRQATASGLFDVATAVTDLDLENDWLFTARHGDFVRKRPRGYGHWLWKPYIILRAMNALCDGDILFYCDSGCEINRFGRRKFSRYLELVRERGVLLFELSHFNEAWSKGDLLVKYPAMIGKKQIMAGVIGFRIDLRNKKLVADWYDLCCSQDYHLIDDTESRIENHVSFVDNRHDQSCLNAILSGYSDLTAISFDEIEGDDHSVYPIIICRNKKRRPKIVTFSIFGMNVFLYRNNRLLTELNLKRATSL
jgi:hypothetical protein